MAIVFPASPSNNDTFTVGSITYTYDGSKWIGLGVTPTDRLLEGSNSLEITAGNELIWTGGKVGVNQVTPIAIFHAKSGANDGTVISTFEGATNNKLNIRFDTFGPVLDVTAGDPLAFEIGGSEKLRIDSSGRLLVGKQSHTGDALFVAESNHTSGGIIGEFDNAATGNFGGVRILGGVTDRECRLQSLYGSSFFTFYTEGTGAAEERLRITSGGFVGINETAPNRNLYISGEEDTAYSLTSGSNNAYLRLHNKDGTDNTGVGNHVGIEMYVANGATSVGMLQMIRTGNNIGDLSYKTRTGASTYRERLRVRNNGDLILGPYDPVGSYTDSALNVPYEIKVAPFGWQNNTEIAGISMGNHSGSTGNDEGEIVFKTTLNAHQGTTGLVERARINNNGSFTVSTYGGLEVNGNPDNFALWQCSGGRITMASSGAWQRMFHCGHTCNATLRLYVTSGNAVNGGGHMFEYKIFVVYGAANISQTASYVYGTTQGNIQSVAVQYNNSGYQLEAQVVWSSGTLLPVVNWVLEGQSSSSWAP